MKQESPTASFMSSPDDDSSKFFPSSLTFSLHLYVSLVISLLLHSLPFWMFQGGFLRLFNILLSFQNFRKLENLFVFYRLQLVFLLRFHDCLESRAIRRRAVLERLDTSTLMPQTTSMSSIAESHSTSGGTPEVEEDEEEEHEMLADGATCSPSSHVARRRRVVLSMFSCFLPRSQSRWHLWVLITMPLWTFVQILWRLFQLYFLSEILRDLCFLQKIWLFAISTKENFILMKKTFI